MNKEDNMCWVSILKRLPNDHQKVIVGRAGEANTMKIITYRKHFDDRHWGDTFESYFDAPTHWMPLPKHPCS